MTVAVVDADATVTRLRRQTPCNLPSQRVMAPGNAKREGTVMYSTYYVHWCGKFHGTPHCNVARQGCPGLSIPGPVATPAKSGKAREAGGPISQAGTSCDREPGPSSGPSCCASSPKTGQLGLIGTVLVRELLSRFFLPYFSLFFFFN